MQITLYEYLAYSSPQQKQAVIDAIEGFGYITQLRNEEDLIDCMAQFVDREGQKGLMALAHVHPDRQLILDSEKSLGFDSESGWAKEPGKETITSLPAKKADTDPHNNHTLVTFCILGAIGIIAVMAIAKG